jgi:hypothetical protein
LSKNQYSKFEQKRKHNKKNYAKNMYNGSGKKAKQIRNNPNRKTYVQL